MTKEEIMDIVWSVKKGRSADCISCGRPELLPLIEVLAESCYRFLSAIENTQKISSQDACKPDFWDMNEKALADHAERMEKLK